MMHEKNSFAEWFADLNVILFKQSNYVGHSNGLLEC